MMNATVTTAHAIENSVFSVKPGIPLGTAFAELSSLIEASKSALLTLAHIEPDSDADIPAALWAVCKNLEMSHALVQAMHQGHLEGSCSQSA